MMPAPSNARPDAGSAKRSYVRGMFTAIAPRYDLLNHVLSLNIDRRWRRRAVNQLRWEAAPAGTYLDLCAGTLDLAIELARRSGFRGRVMGADFVPRMLQLGRRKAPAVRVLAADALELPFGARTFDGCVVGFGVRNLADLDRGLREIARVLKPTSRVVILEFAMPQGWPVRPLYRLYFHRVLPRIGRMVSKHRDAYHYLPASVGDFPEPDALRERMAQAGFTRVAGASLTCGIAALTWGEVP